MPKDKPKSELALAREGKVGKISIIGDIGWDWFGMSYKGFRQELDRLGKINLIELDITSNGGIVTDGVAMMNALVEKDVPVHVYVNGIAASIATVIAMAGDRIFIPDNSLFFLHKPLNMVVGNADEMRKMADDLDKFETAIVNSYQRHFKGTDEEIQALMTADTWMTASEVADKFSNVTVIESGEQEAAAHGDPLEIFGDVIQHQETILDKAVNKVRNRVNGNDPKEVDMPITPEERQELEDGIVAKTTTSIIAALKESGVIKEQEDDPAPVAKVEVPFEGDMTKPEDVQAHADKVALAELQASADMNTLAGVVAYQDALAKHQGRKEIVPASAQATGVPPKKVEGQHSDDDIDAAVARMTGTAN